MIPDSAIEAAHKAWRAQAALEGSIFEYNLRAAIEAAAQIVAAEVWEAGWKACNDWDIYLDMGGDEPDVANPYLPAE